MRPLSVPAIPLCGGSLPHSLGDPHPLISTQVLEMAFAGNCGVSVDLPTPASDPHGPMAALFAEELGLVLEVAPEHEAAVLAAYAAAGVPCAAIGATTAGQDVSVSVGGQQQISGTTPALRDVWEATSFQLERLQCAEENVEAEQTGLAARTAPQWRVPFTPAWTPADKLAATGGCLVCSGGGVDPAGCMGVPCAAHPSSADGSGRALLAWPAPLSARCALTWLAPMPTVSFDSHTASCRLLMHTVCCELHGSLLILWTNPVD